MNEPAWKDLATVVIASLAFLVSLVTFALGQRRGRHHKELEVTMHFQQAYDSLEKLREEAGRSLDSATYWFYRYWNLQVRQFEYWLKGYIDDEIFIHWMQCRRSDFASTRPFFPAQDDHLATDLKDFTYRSGWSGVRDRDVFTKHPYRFREFMDDVFIARDEALGHYIRDAKHALFGRTSRLARLFPNESIGHAYSLRRLRDSQVEPGCLTIYGARNVTPPPLTPNC